MKNNEQFLNLYREYETILRDKGVDSKTFEGQVDDYTSKRLTITRQLRNYLTHTTDPGFIEISDKQILFLQNTIEKIKFEDDVLKKHLKTPKSGMCDEKDKCLDAINKMVRLKQDVLVVTTSKGYAVVDIYEVSKGLLKSKATKLSTVKKTKQFKCFNPLTQIDELPNTTIICTDTGEENGKLLGVFYNKKEVV